MNSIINYDDSYVIKKVNYAPFVESMQAFNERFLAVYREYVNEHYQELYEAYPKYFPFMQPIDWKVVFNNRSIDNYLFEGSANTFATFSNQFTTLGESRVFHRLPSFKQNEKIAELLTASVDHIEVFQVKYGFTAPAIVLDDDYVTEDPNDMPRMGEIKGREFAELHGEKARLEKYELFNLFGLDELIQKINSPSFEYELGESIKSYKNGLYLAAGATGGIALENILRLLIINRIGDKALPDKSYIWKSIEALNKKQILPGHLRAEVIAQNEIRNSNAHTNEDPVSKETVETLYRIIRDVSLLLR